MTADRLNAFLERNGEALRALSRAGFGLCLAAVCILSLLPSEGMPDVRKFDKLGHLLAYGVLMALGLLAVRGRDSQWPLLWALIGLGTVLELAQLWIPGRSFDWLDLGVNALGVGAGLAAMRLVARALPSLGPASR